MGTTNDPTIHPVTGSPNAYTKWLLCDVVYTSGVPAVSEGMGISSITDDGTGLFTIKTVFPWKKLVGGGHIMHSALASGRNAEVVSKNPATKTVQVRITNASGAAADPADGDGVHLMLAFQTQGKTTG